MSKVISPENGDPYAVSQIIDFSFPFAFIALCKMLQVTPMEILMGLTYDIGSEVSVSNGLVHQRATEYFLSQGYGQGLFTKEQVRQMIAELGIVKGLVDFNDIGKVEHNYFPQWGRLRESYYRVWEKKWRGKMKPVQPK